MPTIIDSLIVSLNLNTAQFTQAQRQAVTQLQQLQTQAGQTGSQVTTVTGHLNRFLNAINHPIQATVQNLNQLGQAGLASGNIIARGAGTGAYGLAALTAAGLGAFATIKALQGAFRELTTTMTSSAAVGRLAQWFGGPGATGMQGAPGVAPWLSREAIAARISTHARPEETMQNLFQLQQDIQNLYTRGVFSDRLRSLTRLGITNFGQGTSEDIQRIIRQLTTILPGIDPARAQSLLGGVFSREYTQFLQQGPAFHEQQSARANQIALTDQQVQAFIREQQALDRLSDTWTSFIRKLETDAAPWVTTMVNKFSDWLTELQKDPEALKAVETGVAALAAVFGVTLVAAITKAIVAINSFWAAPLIRFLTSVAGAGFLAGLLAFLYPKSTNEGEQEYMRKHPELFPRVLPPEGYGEGKDDGRTLWERHAPSWLGGKDAPTGGPSGLADPRYGSMGIRAYNYGNIGVSPGLGPGAARHYGSPEEGVDAIRQNILAYQQQHGLNTVAGIINRWSPPGENATNELIRKAAAYMGVGPNDPLNLNDPAVMKRLTEAIILQEQGRIPPPAQAAIAKLYPAPGLAQASPSPVSQYSAGLGMVRSANASVNNTTNNNTTHDNDVNVGQINVTTTGDPYKVGGAVAGAIRRQVLVSGANTGLE